MDKKEVYEEIVWLEDCISGEVYPYSLRLGKLTIKEFSQYISKKPMKITLEWNED